MPYIYVPPFEFGTMSLDIFTLFVWLAIVVGYFVTRQRCQVSGLSIRVMNRMGVWIVIGVFAMAHLVSVLFYSPHRVVEDPLILVRFWEGLSSFGGLLGSIIFGLAYCRIKGIAPGPYADALTFGALAALTVGRIGCSLVHDHPGTITEFPLAVTGWPGEYTVGRTFGFYTDGLTRHDLGLYELVFLIFLNVLIWSLRNFRPFEHFHIVVVLILYAPVRFGFDFLRTADERYGGFTPGQYFAVALMLLAIELLLRGLRKRRDHSKDATNTS